MLNANFRSCIDRSGLQEFPVALLYVQQLTTDLRIARLAMTKDCFPSEPAYRAHVGEIVRGRREIVEAICTRDAERAEQLARSHADLARKRVSERLTQTMTPQWTFVSVNKRWTAIMCEVCAIFGAVERLRPAARREVPFNDIQHYAMNAGAGSDC
ncbi:hypothetical protein [Bradyrhizobium sp. AUGA SZCCT0182]|uniref:hypothetical protein n=1 Tax=Bradyrhizobium sp. AUGA SZCCT0182 TaxID=2807667 RepID=UPI001BA4F529|nr:hypothetical protein [Bradyrhizobium sp. AUGA SZCCT0182]MBR1231779.1 hypothetical protein [Bradyrhizobium sp. AUGA SZCCT0182]